MNDVLAILATGIALGVTIMVLCLVVYDERMTRKRLRAIDERVAAVVARNQAEAEATWHAHREGP